MSDEPEDEERSLYLRLLLGLLPFDVDITVEVIQDLLSEADKTSWPSVMRRSANLGLVISTVGVVGSAILFYQIADFSDTPIRYIGPMYRVGFAAIGLMWFAKTTLGFMQNIHTGDSPLVPRDESNRVTSLLEFMIGVSFIGLVTIPVYEIWDLEVLLALFLIVAVVGIAIAGICLTVSGFIGVVFQKNGPPDDSAVGRPDNREMK